MRKRFHTIEKLTDYGARQVLFKKGNKILAWAEQRPSLSWEYSLGKPNQKPRILHITTGYSTAEYDIIRMLEDNNIIPKINRG